MQKVGSLWIVFFSLISCNPDRCPYFQNDYTNVGFDVVVDSLWHDINRDFVFMGHAQQNSKSVKYGSPYLTDLFLQTDKGDRVVKNRGTSIAYLYKRDKRDTLKFDYECRNGDIYLNGKKQ